MQGSQNLDEGYDILQQIDAHHTPYIFPWCPNGTCNRTATMISGSEDNTWSEWAEVADSSGNKLSDLFATKGGYIGVMIPESVSRANTLFQIEFAYGDGKTIITRLRIFSEDLKLPTDSGKNLRNNKIPAGEKVYGRCASEKGGESVTGHLRFYYEDGV